MSRCLSKVYSSAEIAPKRGHRLPGRCVGVGVRQCFRGREPLVADVSQRRPNGRVLEVPQASGPAVGIDEVTVADVAAGVWEGGRQVRLLIIHVKQAAKE